MELVKEIADNLNLINVIINNIHCQNFFNALKKIKVMTEKLVSIIEELQNKEEFRSFIDSNYIMTMLNGICNAQKNKDYVLLADLLEMQLVPFLLQVQELLIENKNDLENNEIWGKNLNSLKNKDKDLLKKINTFKLQGKCTIESTSSGLFTLKMKDSTGEYYFHSNGNPQIEGNDFAKNYYSIEKNHYLIFGLGLGYHIKAFLDIDDGLYIDIIEPDLNIIKIANQYIDLDWLYNNPRINLIYDDTYQKWNQLLLKKNVQFIIHYPSLRHIENETIKLAMEKLFIRDSGIRNFRIQFENDFRENILNYDEYIDVLRPKFQEKNAIIVAAGPSLDKNIKLLLEKPKETIILAVGTVFKKLIRLGISPDYVIFLDAQPSLYEQVVGLENLDIPIIFASTACKTIGKNYKGKKYLICQKDFIRAEEFAQKNDYQLYETGGSVSTIALDLCIRLGCKEIAYIGLDLAFTNNMAHATDTSKTDVGYEEKTVMISSIEGDLIASRKLFVIYRDWIIKRVKKEDAKGKVIDATEGGALIEGLRIQTLKQTMEKWK